MTEKEILNYEDELIINQAILEIFEKYKFSTLQDLEIKALNCFYSHTDETFLSRLCELILAGPNVDCRYSSEEHLNEIKYWMDKARVSYENSVVYSEINFVDCGGENAS